MSKNTKNAVSEIEIKELHEPEWKKRFSELFQDLSSEAVLGETISLEAFLCALFSEKGPKSKIWSSEYDTLRDELVRHLFRLPIAEKAGNFNLESLKPKFTDFTHSTAAFENANLFYAIAQRQFFRPDKVVNAPDKVENTSDRVVNTFKTPNNLVLFLNKLEEFFRKISDLFSQDVLPKNSQKPVSPSNCPSAFFPTKPAKPVSVEPAAVPSPGLSH